MMTICVSIRYGYLEVEKGNMLNPIMAYLVSSISSITVS